jgi:aspartate ammonia-lyase
MAKEVMEPKTEPQGVLWGARTTRWLARSRAGAMKYQEARLHPLMFDALAMTYKARIATHRALDQVTSADKLKTQILTEILSGQWKEQMVVDPLSSPFGEAVLDNFNEILEGRVRQLLGINPDDPEQEHISDNPLTGADYYLVASRVAMLISLKDLESTLLELERLVLRKFLEIEMSLSVGDKELTPAVKSIRQNICRQFKSFGGTAERHLRQIKATKERLLEMPLSESVGFCKIFARELSIVSGLKLLPGESIESGKICESALIDIAQVAAAQKQLALELVRLCRAYIGVEEEFTEPDVLKSFKDTLHLACIRVQAEENQVTLALETHLGPSACPALTIACQSILTAADALKSSIRSFNHGYVAKAILR